MLELLDVIRLQRGTFNAIWKALRSEQAGLIVVGWRENGTVFRGFPALRGRTPFPMGRGREGAAGMSSVHLGATEILRAGSTVMRNSRCCIGIAWLHGFRACGPIERDDFSLRVIQIRSFYQYTSKNCWILKLRVLVCSDTSLPHLVGFFFF